MKNTLRQKIAGWLTKDYRMTFMERIHLLEESEKKFEHLPYALRYGETLRYILERVSLPVDNDELLIGSVVEEIPTEEEAVRITAMYRSWWNLPDEEIQKKILWFYSDGWLKCRPPWFYSFGHLAPDWEGLINRGLDELADNARASLNEFTAAGNPDSDRVRFLQGAIICYEAIQLYIERYAQSAHEAGRIEQSENLRKLAHQPAESLEDALQLIWFLTLVMAKVAGCGVLNYDRMDLYLYPFFRSDIDSGKITREEALDLIEDFYFKNNEIMLPVDHMSQETKEVQAMLEVTYDDPNYLTIGGLRADGSSAVNELSYLLLKATAQLKLRNPYMVVRWHPGIDQAFWRRTVEAMRDNATVVVYNDSTMIPALRRMGVEEPEVFDYGFFGCNDPVIGPYEGGLRQLWFNLARPLQLAMYQGNDPMQPAEQLEPENCQYSLRDRMIGLMTGPYYGLPTMDPREMKNMDDFIEAYRRQVFYLLSNYRQGFEQDRELEMIENKGRIRIEDCFLKGTIENAETWNDGGTKYHKIVAQATGLATVADSLYAIDKLVFQEKSMSMNELLDLLSDNYESAPDMMLKLKKRYAKFGNDIPEVDRYADLVTNIYCDAIESVNGPQYLYQLWPTLSSDRDFTTMGLDVAATPDGRVAGEQLSENQSPAAGADRHGLTAMFNSLMNVPFDRITGGPLNVRIHPSAVQGDDGLSDLAAVFETYMKGGGMQLQINVVDSKQLREAQKHPDQYRDLCVRVTGYSAFFVQMGRKAQEELIRRTEQQA